MKTTLTTTAIERQVPVDPTSGATRLLSAAAQLVASLGLVVFAGCSSLNQPPPELAHIQIDLAHSPVVSVSRAALVREHGLVLKGHVLRQHDATDTTRTHLDVTLLDAQGRVLRETIERFAPAQIPRRVRMPDSASFSVVLDPLPAGTSRIVVRAHEGPH
jgi:hypothetical protein